MHRIKRVNENENHRKSFENLIESNVTTLEIIINFFGPRIGACFLFFGFCALVILGMCDLL